MKEIDKSSLEIIDKDFNITLNIDNSIISPEKKIPLSHITDEHALEIAYAYYKDHRGVVIKGEEQWYIEDMIKKVVYHFDLLDAEILSYLKSKNYDLS